MAILTLPFPAYCKQQLIKEKISFVSEDARIFGLLRLPQTPGPYPANVGVHGSCWQLRVFLVRQQFIIHEWAKPLRGMSIVEQVIWREDMIIHV
ncbi:hypothetical protein IID62_11225 [candidate division KSB1 bacterium]|nr:hypothetical protein [candidate division KSB1 bacterium]